MNLRVSVSAGNCVIIIYRYIIITFIPFHSFHFIPYGEIQAQF